MKKASAALLKKLRARYWAEIHMREAKAVCGLIRRPEEKPSQEITFGLQTGAIISYCRSFGANRGLEPLPAEFSKFPNQHQQALHKHLIKVRNLTYAHKDFVRESELLSAADKDEVTKIRVIVADDGSTEWVVNRSSPKADYIKKVEDLCQFQQQRLNQASSKMLADACRGKSYKSQTYTLGEGFP